MAGGQQVRVCFHHVLDVGGARFMGADMDECAFHCDTLSWVLKNKKPAQGGLFK